MNIIVQKLIKGIHHPSKFWIWTVFRLSPILPDKLYLQLLFHHFMGKWIDWKNPKNFNEKLQWLKLYNRQPEYTILADKVKAKEWVAARIGEEYIIPTLGVWDNPDDIDFDALPNQFVLKCNHNSGTGMYICKDKSKMDVEAVKKGLRKGLKENYFLHGREWPYKNIPRRILAEKYMVDESGIELKDYKVFNFNGEPEIIEVDFDRFSHHGRNFYDKNWNSIEMEIEYPSNRSRQIARPEHLEQMLDLARTLAKGIPHVRTDFYSIEGKLYFGELTFFHEAGMGHFRPIEWDERLGRLIKLPNRGGVIRLHILTDYADIQT